MHPKHVCNPTCTANARAAPGKRPIHPRDARTSRNSQPSHTTQAHKRARGGLAHGRICRAHAPPRAVPPCESHAKSRRAPSTRAVCWALPTAYAAPAAKPPASALPPARSHTTVPLNLHQEPPPPPSAVPLRAACPHHKPRRDKPTTSRIGNKHRETETRSHWTTLQERLELGLKGRRCYLRQSGHEWRSLRYLRSHLRVFELGLSELTLLSCDHLVVRRCFHFGRSLPSR